MIELDEHARATDDDTRQHEAKPFPAPGKKFPNAPIMETIKAKRLIAKITSSTGMD